MPGSFNDELFNNIRNGFCTILEVQRNYHGYMGQNPFFITSRLARGFFDVSYRIFCNREPPPIPDPEFSGGQCDGVKYRVDVYTELLKDGSPTNDFGYPSSGYLLSLDGKIVGLQDFSDDTSIELRVVHDDGAKQQFAFGIGGGAANGYQYTNFRITSVTRMDGLPDECGDPPPPIPVPEPGFNQPDLDFNYSPDFGPDININGNFIFAPVRVNLNGELTIPVRINLGGINPEFNGNINLNNPKLELNFGNPNYNRDGLPNPDGYKAPDDTPDVPDDVPDDVPNPPPTSNDDDTTRILRACIVTVSNVPDDITEIFQDS
ncbi:MAG TPA: hypothetical protein VF433_03860, partial [Cellvibrio sp.]